MNAVSSLKEELITADGDRSPSALTATDFTFLLFGHAAFQYLHAGAAFGLFELFFNATNGLLRSEIASATGLSERPIRCLLFGLTALRLVKKEGERYSNSPLIDAWIDSGEWKIIVDTIMFEAHIVYAGQSDFVQSLREDTNVGLRHIPGTERDLYHRLSETPALQKIFYDYMSSWSRLSNPFLLGEVDFSRWRRLLDVGGGDATNAIAIAAHYTSAQVSVLELSSNADVARDKITRANLNERVRVIEGDMFVEEFPKGHDCIMFIHQLVIWPFDTIAKLLQKAYDALPVGGSTLIFSSISDDSGGGPVMAALDSVYFMSIPAEGGMIHAWEDYTSLLKKVGFSTVKRHRCQSWTPHGVIVATK